MPREECPQRTAEWENAKHMAIVPPSIELNKPWLPPSRDYTCAYCRRIHNDSTCPGCGAPKTSS